MTNESKWLKRLRKLVNTNPPKKPVHIESLLEVTNNSVPKEKQDSPKLKANTPVRIQSECPFCGNDEILMGNFNIIGQILKYRCPRCQHSFDRHGEQIRE